MTHKSLKVGSQKVFFRSSEDQSDLNEEVDLIVTSPPYWNLKDYGNSDQIGQGSYDKYLERLNLVWNQCHKYSKKDAILIVNVGTRRFQKKYLPIAMDIYRTMEKWKLIEEITWFIPNALPLPNYYINKLFDNKKEQVLVFAKNYDYNYTFNKLRVPQKYKSKDTRKGKLNEQGRCIGNVIRIPAYRPPTIKQQTYYSAAFPEELVDFLIRSFSNEGDIILDPFLGSGTTLKVARNLKRKGVGYEINSEIKSTIKQKILEEWEPLDINKIDLINGFITNSTKRRT